MKKRKFLVPLAVSVAALTLGEDADAMKSIPDGAQATEISKTISSSLISSDFVIEKSQDTVQYAQHRSHYSHRSHSSHSSHRSHYSSRY